MELIIYRSSAVDIISFSYKRTQYVNLNYSLFMYLF